MRRYPISTLFLVLLGCCVGLAAEAPRNPDFNSDPFQKHWYDGKAELAGYELTIPRYGQTRKGEAVTIFVYEPFSNSARVKADPGKHPATDEFPVMKLNLVEDFATGVYDYNLMTSVFVAMSSVNNLPPGTPTKVSFSSQEWCGHVYEQMLFDSSSIRRTRHSYFDGEGDVNDTLEFPKNGISEDSLLFWARGAVAAQFIDAARRNAQLIVPPGRRLGVCRGWIHDNLYGAGCSAWLLRHRPIMEQAVGSDIGGQRLHLLGPGGAVVERDRLRQALLEAAERIGLHIGAHARELRSRLCTQRHFNAASTRQGSGRHDQR